MAARVPANQPKPGGCSQVLFTVCDSYIRRNEQQERVIGTLLGRHGCGAARRPSAGSSESKCSPLAHPRSVSPDGTVEIKNSYAVPHNESGGQARQDTCVCAFSRPNPPHAYL